eukprot:scaffold217392_cov35-Tisochrysis_lutea.AAC.2
MAPCAACCSALVERTSAAALFVSKPEVVSGAKSRRCRATRNDVSCTGCRTAALRAAAASGTEASKSEMEPSWCGWSGRPELALSSVSAATAMQSVAAAA